MSTCVCIRSDLLLHMHTNCQTSKGAHTHPVNGQNTRAVVSLLIHEGDLIWIRTMPRGLNAGKCHPELHKSSYFISWANALPHTASVYHSLGLTSHPMCEKTANIQRCFAVVTLFTVCVLVTVGVDPPFCVVRMHHTAHSLSADECSAHTDRQTV